MPYLFAGLDEVVLDPSRVPWIRPPPVANRSHVGLDTFIEQLLDNGEIVMRKMGRTYKPTERFVFYDRAGHRRLFFPNDVVPPPGVLDRNTFGQPVPVLRFLDAEGPIGSPDVEVVASKWMYRDHGPRRHEVNLVMAQPTTSELPPLETMDNTAVPMEVEVSNRFTLPSCPLIISN
jgi:hypothetical protein